MTAEALRLIQRHRTTARPRYIRVTLDSGMVDSISGAGRLRDSGPRPSAGTPVSGAAVAWILTSGSGLPSASSTTTDSFGNTYGAADLE